MELFLIAPPGLAHLVGEEAREQGFKVTAIAPEGVTLEGDWPDAWRANLVLRGATRVLVRVAAFRAMHLAQLDKRARKLPWGDWLRPDVPVTVEATCRKSRIYHDKAAAQRIGTAITEMTGAPLGPGGVAVRLRIEDDLATVSLDTSGALLHRRGLKPEVNKAPMRETLAALFLRAAGYDGSMPVVDPMCGSGTFVIEAAEIALGLAPGRARRFAFEHLASFDRDAYAALTGALPSARETTLRFHGSDRDAGAVAMSAANAERSGVGHVTGFARRAISDAAPPDGPPGLVIANPPYGGRIGKTGALTGLYAGFGEVMRTRYHGWRVAMITTDAGLAKATGLDWAKPGPIVDHGGIKVRLWQTQP